MLCASLPTLADWQVTDQAKRMPIVSPALTPHGFLKAKSRETCRSNGRQNSSLSSILSLQESSAWPCQCTLSRSPKLSNDVEMSASDPEIGSSCSTAQSDTMTDPRAS